MSQDNTDPKKIQKQIDPGEMQNTLEQYRTDEAAGLLLRLPVPLGTQVWQVKNNPACHQWVQDAEKFLYGKVITPKRVVTQISFTLDLLSEWGHTVFLTEAEGQALIEQDEQSIEKIKEGCT